MTELKKKDAKKGKMEENESSGTKLQLTKNWSEGRIEELSKLSTNWEL